MTFSAWLLSAFRPRPRLRVVPPPVPTRAPAAAVAPGAVAALPVDARVDGDDTLPVPTRAPAPAVNDGDADRAFPAMPRPLLRGPVLGAVPPTLTVLKPDAT